MKIKTTILDICNPIVVKNNQIIIHFSIKKKILNIISNIHKSY